MPQTNVPSPNEVLQALLEAHGHPTKERNGRLKIENHDVAMSAQISVRNEENPALLQLDVRLHLADGRTLTESFAGTGREMRFALGDAFDNFCQSSFHVLLQAFLGDDRDVVQEEWDTRQGQFKALIGNLIFKGHWPSDTDSSGWFNHFAGHLHRTQWKRHTTWIRFYYAQDQGQTVACEVLVNSVVWEGMQEEMLRFPWPHGEGFTSVRVFLVLQPN